MNDIWIYYWTILLFFEFETTTQRIDHIVLIREFNLNNDRRTYYGYYNSETESFCNHHS